MTVARLAGRVAGGSTGPGVSFLLGGMGLCWSGGVRDGLEVLGPLLVHAVEQVHGSDH